MKLSIKTERRIFSILLLIVALLTIFDLFEDWEEGVSLAHVFVEATIILLSCTGAFYLIHLSISFVRSEKEKLVNQIVSAREDAKKWKQDTAKLLEGLSVRIDEQFDLWELTDSEKEVGMLLLKGLSLKEVANIRETSERTVRHQAAAVYRKARLDGRAQLSAFFLEDLFVPQSSNSELR